MANNKRPPLEFSLQGNDFRYNRPSVSEALAKVVPLAGVLLELQSGGDTAKGLSSIVPLIDFYAEKTEVKHDTGNGKKVWMPLVGLEDLYTPTPPDYLAFGVKIFMEENSGFLPTSARGGLYETMAASFGFPSESETTDAGTSGE